MKNTFKNFADKVKNIGNLDFLGTDAKAEYKVPLLDLAFIPVGVVFYYIKKFLLFASVFALLITVLSSIMGFNLMCSFPAYRENAYYGCIFSFEAYSAFFVLRLALIAIFLRIWYKIAVKGERVKIKEIFANPKHDLKIFAILLCFIFINLLPMVSFVVLYLRVPNPDWKIETLFFAFVSIGFLLPFVAVRFYSLPAFIMEDKKIPKFGELLTRTYGNTLKILLALSIITILFLIIFINFNVLAETSFQHAPLVTGAVMDFLYNILLLFFFAMLTNHFVMQKVIFFGLYEEDD